MKLSNARGMCVSLWRLETTLGPWVKVQSHRCGALAVQGWCEALVTNWKSLTRWWRHFCGLWLRSNGRRSSSGRRETRYQLLTGLHRDLQQNHDTVDRGPGGRKWGNIHRWAWWEHIQTDTATQPVWAIAVFSAMILTFIPLWVERYKCDSSLQQFEFWSSWCFELSRAFSFPMGMFSEVDVRFASSFHALCSRHVDPPELRWTHPQHFVI